MQIVSPLFEFGAINYLTSLCIEKVARFKLRYEIEDTSTIAHGGSFVDVVAVEEPVS